MFEPKTFLSSVAINQNKYPRSREGKRAQRQGSKEMGEDGSWECQAGIMYKYESIKEQI